MSAVLPLLSVARAPSTPILSHVPLRGAWVEDMAGEHNQIS